MRLLELKMEDASWLDPMALHTNISQCQIILIRWTQPDLYRANSKSDITCNWLITWYLAEKLAEHATQAEFTVDEFDTGAGLITLTLSGSNASGLTMQIQELADIFDPDDLEASALIHDEATEWLETRYKNKATFPSLEQIYRDEFQSTIGNDDLNDE